MPARFLYFFLLETDTSNTARFFFIFFRVQILKNGLSLVYRSWDSVEWWDTTADVMDSKYLGACSQGF